MFKVIQMANQTHRLPSKSWNISWNENTEKVNEMIYLRRIFQSQLWFRCHKKDDFDVIYNFLKAHQNSQKIDCENLSFSSYDFVIFQESLLMLLQSRSS